jgi:hypothetical protein
MVLGYLVMVNVLKSVKYLATLIAEGGRRKTVIHEGFLRSMNE